MAAPTVERIERMERETALLQLQNIRQEILATHSNLETCQALQKQIEALQNEKEHPQKPAVPLKPDNTAPALQQQFERQNRNRLYNSRLPGILLKLINTVVQAVAALLLGLDVFGQKGLFISNSALLALNKEDASNGAVLFTVHLLLALAVTLVPLLWRFVHNKMKTAWKVILLVPFALLGCAYLVMCSGAKTAVYLLALPGGVVLGLAVGGAARLVQRARLKATALPLSAAQKKQVAAAAAADERAKAENAQRLAEAQDRWNTERQQRLTEIDRELQQKAQQFHEARAQVKHHMERLDAMDALCEDDKTLQTVDLLIRFIQTRRADSVKEALQEYDKLMANRQLLEIEKQKLAAELQRSAQEHADRLQQLEQQRRHQSEMEYLAWDSAQTRAKMAGQLDHLGAMVYYNLNN